MFSVLLHAPTSPFYSPKGPRSHWSSIWKAVIAFYPWAHRTVNNVQFLSLYGEADRCQPLVPWHTKQSGGASDNPLQPGDRCLGIRGTR
jgi:hypothetical protein